MRVSRLCRHAAAPMRPYRRVQQAMDQGGRGLLVAAEVFKEFKSSYRAATAAAAASSSASMPRSSAAFGAGGARPLTAFCGSPREVEPLTILLLKVLCDLRRLEEMRFLFTQCVLELEEQTPSIELFNVYLLAVSMTDTFNEHEIENVVELMRVKGARPDIVTKLSMFMLYLRLGRESHVATWWPLIREETESILADSALAQYPLLPLRLQHCFQTLTRLHYDQTAVHECFQLLRAVSPGSCTAALLVPYMVLGVTNNAVPPSAVVEVLQTLEAAREAAIAAAAAAAAAAPPASSYSLEAATPAPPPALNSEVTAFRLLAKCARWKDAASAEYVREYLRCYSPLHTIISAENAPVAALLYIEALAQSGRAADALAVVEAEVPAPLNRMGERPKLFLESRRMMLLSSDPLTNLVGLIARDGGAGVDAVLLELRAGGGEEGRPAPTAASLDLVMAACAQLADTARAERLLGLYGPAFGAAPGPSTFAALLRAYCGEATSATAGVARLQALISGGGLTAAGARLTPELLRAALQVSLAARDLGAVLTAAELHAEAGAGIDHKQGVWMLRELTLLADADGVRRALRAMRASKSPIDAAVVEQCVSALTQWNVDCTDIRTV